MRDGGVDRRVKRDRQRREVGDRPIRADRIEIIEDEGCLECAPECQQDEDGCDQSANCESRAARLQKSRRRGSLVVAPMLEGPALSSALSIDINAAFSFFLT